MTGFFATALDYRDFWDRDAIVELAQRSVSDHTVTVDYAIGKVHSRAMLIFATSKQQTWLVTLPNLVCCVLDDRRKEEPRVQWTMPYTELQPVRADVGLKASTGIVYFGSRPKGWLYSKKLFSNQDVVRSIDAFLNDAEVIVDWEPETRSGPAISA